MLVLLEDYQYLTMVQRERRELERKERQIRVQLLIDVARFWDKLAKNPRK